MFTCGGTGGHINPAIAVASLLRERKPDSQILFVGGAGGMECSLVPKAGFQLETLDPRSFRRGFTPKDSWQSHRRVSHGPLSGEGEAAHPYLSAGCDCGAEAVLAFLFYRGG
ncbi:MAG: glycosyltransferase [Oscillospiraceae bacterium]